jgi:hypothetical protein
MIGKRIDGPYTVIGNEAAQDSSLSWKARGLLVYLLSLPRDWNIRISELANHATDGYDSTKRAMDELLKSGYIKRGPRVRKPDGKLGDYVYLVTGVRDEGPNMEKPNLDFPSQEKPSQEKPSQENRQLQNKEITKETKNKRNKRKYVSKSYSEDFEIWWKYYLTNSNKDPGDKWKAFENFNYLLQSFSLEQIQRATAHYFQSCGDKFTKDATTFLKGELIDQYQEPPIVPIRGKPQEQPRKLTAQEQSVKRMLEDYAERNGETGNSGFGNGFNEFEQTHTGRIAPTLGSSLLQ